MDNFEFHNPVNLIFGKNTIKKLTELLPENANIMITYGGGSIKKNGVYEQVVKALEGKNYIEFGGIEGNPQFTTLMKAVEKAREKKVDFLLSVGGGSVLDGTKFIAAAIPFKGDTWNILTSMGADVKSAVAIASVMTLPATGSEMNMNSVVSRKETDEKLYFANPLVYPKFSILDPEATYSLPDSQVRNGIVDSFIHVCEQYITFPAAASLQDRFSEGVIQTLVEEGPKTLKDTKDYDSRANFFLCSTMALNGVISMGVPQDWSTHMIGHELTAFYGVAHAESLAIVLIGMWNYCLEEKKEKLEQLGKRVFGVKTAKETIDAVEKFFHSLDMPTTLSPYKIDAEEAAKKISERFKERGAVFGEKENITPEAVTKILLSRK